jgi:hypothetical protein
MSALRAYLFFVSSDFFSTEIFQQMSEADDKKNKS